MVKKTEPQHERVSGIQGSFMSKYKQNQSSSSSLDHQSAGAGAAAKGGGKRK